jgi:hypothetical protein
MGLVALVAAWTVASGCTSAKAQVVLPDSAPLTIPQAPPRVVVPPAPVAPPAAVETEPPTSSTSSANPPANSARPNRDPKPVPPPPANPPAPTPPPAPTSPAAPATPLETPANQGELEQRTQGLLLSAKAALDKINIKALSADGKAQHDAATRFIAQAQEALRVKNTVYAWQLADKANTIATLLLRHS